MKIGQRSIGWNRLIELQLPGRLLALFAFAGAAWLIVVPVALAISGSDGALAATLAAMICLASGEAALLAASSARGPYAAMNGALIAMLVRMAGPLAAGVALHVGSPVLAASGLIFYVLVFYMFDLAVETMLQVSTLNTADAAREVTG